jgi:hypothetical protein
MKKTNASRILNKLKIPYEILEYEVGMSRTLVQKMPLRRWGSP